MDSFRLASRFLGGDTERGQGAATAGSPPAARSAVYGKARGGRSRSYDRPAGTGCGTRSHMTKLAGTERERMLDVFAQSDAIHRLEGFEPTALRKQFDQAVLDGLATNALPTRPEPFFRTFNAFTAGGRLSARRSFRLTCSGSSPRAARP